MSRLSCFRCSTLRSGPSKRQAQVGIALQVATARASHGKGTWAMSACPNFSAGRSRGGTFASAFSGVGRVARAYSSKTVCYAFLHDMRRQVVKCNNWHFCGVIKR